MSAALVTAGAGAGLTLVVSTYTLFRYARQVARFLLAFAAAREAFRQTWRRGGQAPGNGPVSIGKARPGQPPPLDAIQRETVSALVNFGQARKKAEATVRAAGTAADVATLLRRCTERAA